MATEKAGLALRDRLDRWGELVLAERERVLRRIAYHEAGHFVAAGAYGRFVSAVLLDPAGGGSRMQMEGLQDGLRSPEGSREDIEFLRQQIVIYLVGGAAEKRHEPSGTVFMDGGDLKIARALAWQLVGRLASEKEVLGELARAAKEGASLVAENWELVEAVAAWLLQGDVLRKRVGVRVLADVARPAEPAEPAKGGTDGRAE